MGDIDTVTKMMLALSKAKGTVDIPETFFTKFADIVSPQLKTLNIANLVKIALAIGKFPTCKGLLESAGKEGMNRVSDMAPAHMLLFTQGLGSLGVTHPVFVEYVEYWATS